MACKLHLRTIAGHPNDRIQSEMRQPEQNNLRFSSLDLLAIPDRPGSVERLD